MKKKLTALLLLLLPFCLAGAQNMNFGWKFHLGDVANGASPQLDDSQWRTVDVPHDFQIEQPWVMPNAGEKADNNDPAANIISRLSSRGFKEMGKGWYRMHLTPADSLRGHRLLLQFDGIMYTADVYLNGELIGGTDYGYVGFEIDVTDRLRFGQDNVIAVMADTRQPGNSRWYTGGGLFRHVRLVSTSKELYFERHPLYITTRDNKYVTVGAEYTNRGRDKSVKLRLTIYAPDGTEVLQTTESHQRLTPTRTQEMRMKEQAIDHPLTTPTSTAPRWS